MVELVFFHQYFLHLLGILYRVKEPGHGLVMVDADYAEVVLAFWQRALGFAIQVYAALGFLTSGHCD